MKYIKSLLLTLSLVFVFSLAISAQTVTLNSLDGERVNVQGQRGKIVVLAIGASWLPLSSQQFRAALSKLCVPTTLV